MIYKPQVLDSEVIGVGNIEFLEGEFSKIVAITKNGMIYYTDDYINFKPLEVKDHDGNKINPKFKFMQGQLFFDENNNMYMPDSDSEDNNSRSPRFQIYKCVFCYS